MTQQISEERRLALYNQNSEHFRGLNTQMWQIPIIAMTLTGGLWFGVSSVKDSPVFQMGLLSLALIGNVALIIVLARLRFVMRGYLDWINQHEPDGRIDLTGTGFSARTNAVRTTFQIVLGITAAISLGLIVMTALKWHEDRRAVGRTSVDVYDGYAAALADEYEVPDFVLAHPFLAKFLQDHRRLSILDLGSGAARDAIAMKRLGHDVVVGQPSPRLLQVTRRSGVTVRSFYSPLPELPGIRGADRFDLIVVNAALVHVPPARRQALIDELMDTLRPGGQIYATFRDGPADRSGLAYRTSVAELRRLTAGSGARVVELGVRPDLAGRSDVKWRTVLISSPSDEGLLAPRSHRCPNVHEIVALGRNGRVRAGRLDGTQREAWFHAYGGC